MNSPRRESVVSFGIVWAPSAERNWKRNMVVPGPAARREASQATTSVTSWSDIGLPGTLPRQSGAPSSGRPVMTMVRSPWSLTSARNESSVMALPFGPPRPSGP